MTHRVLSPHDALVVSVEVRRDGWSGLLDELLVGPGWEVVPPQRISTNMRLRRGGWYWSVGRGGKLVHSVSYRRRVAPHWEWTMLVRQAFHAWKHDPLKGEAVGDHVLARGDELVLRVEVCPQGISDTSTDFAGTTSLSDTRSPPRAWLDRRLMDQIVRSRARQPLDELVIKMSEGHAGRWEVFRGGTSLEAITAPHDGDWRRVVALATNAWNREVVARRRLRPSWDEIYDLAERHLGAGDVDPLSPAELTEMRGMFGRCWPDCEGCSGGRTATVYRTSRRPSR